MDRLIAELIDRQEREGWSEREMARQLGISEASWHRIRSGTRGMGTSVIRRVLFRFPEFTHLAIAFFLEADASPSDVSATTERVA